MGSKSFWGCKRGAEFPSPLRQGARTVLLALALCGLGACPVLAQEPAGGVTDCDRYAASEFDKEAPVKGTPFAKIDPKVAIPACIDAVAKAPDSVRLNFQLGRAYDAKKEFPRAREFFLKAAEGHFALAQVNLGSLYFNGQGVARDYAEAARWDRLAADQGLAPAQANLGAMYLKGQGVAEDDAEGVKLLTQAAAQGFAPAQNTLGTIYASGQVAAQDFTKALQFYRSAAEQGYAPAQANLGAMYANGRGVARSYSEAMKWYRLAADQGYESDETRRSAGAAQGGASSSVDPGYPPVKIVVRPSREGRAPSTAIDVSPLSSDFSMSSFSVNKGQCQPYKQDPASIPDLDSEGSTATDNKERDENIAAAQKALAKIAITAPPFNPPISARPGQFMTFYVNAAACDIQEVEVIVNDREWTWPPR
jgi:TPR repeat protein